MCIRDRPGLTARSAPAMDVRVNKDVNSVFSCGSEVQDDGDVRWELGSGSDVQED